MGFRTKGKRDSHNNSNESWGLGFFLVFFPDDEEQQQQQSSSPTDHNIKNTTTTIISNSFKSTTPPQTPLTTRRRLTASSSSYALLSSKAQSTISICALLVFLSLLFFSLSSFDSTSTSITPSSLSTRRHLSSPKPIYQNTLQSHSPHHSALQGLGELYRKGTRPTNDLVVAHVPESVTDQELRLFLRLFYKSPLSSKSDLSFIFPSPSHSSAFNSLIFQETESFFKLVNRTHFPKPSKSTVFDVDDEREVLKNEKETIWGKGVSNWTESTRASYGSVVGFGAEELDPENSLSGFLDHVPMNMRRWACYPMLLGRVRKNFKHVLLVDVKDVFLLGDPMGLIRTRSPESVQLLSAEAVNKPHGKRNSGKGQSSSGRTVNPAVVMGGARGIRRISNAMLTEIVRVTTQHKKKNPVTESGLFNQLVSNEFILKNVKVVTSGESVPEVSSLTGLNSNSGLSNYTMLRRGNGNGNIDSTSIIMKHVCGLELDSSVYSDCL